jgi:hypothetical protein
MSLDILFAEIDKIPIICVKKSPIEDGMIGNKRILGFIRSFWGSFSSNPLSGLLGESRIGSKRSEVRGY